MILSLFVLDTLSNKKVFRSIKSITTNKINFYLNEFTNTNKTEDQGIINKDFYDFIYILKNNFYFVAITLKNTFYSQVMSDLNFIINNSSNDMFDILFTIDNLFYEDLIIKDNLNLIKELDSQDEKIFNLMMESKKKEDQKKMEEMKMFDKIKNLNVDQNIVQKPITKPKLKKYHSEFPILILLKEKLNIETDKENVIKQNLINGDLNLIISDEKYKKIEIKYKNSLKNIKHSPYLDKNALKNKILRFEKERQLNKSIPLLKYNTRLNSLPLNLDIWTDEDDKNFINSISVYAKKCIKNLKIKIRKEKISDVEILADDYEELENEYQINISEIKENESYSFELKNNALNQNEIFPFNLEFDTEAENNIEIEKVSLDEDEIKDYEFRKIIEVEKYKITE